MKKKYLVLSCCLLCLSTMSSCLNDRINYYDVDKIVWECDDPCIQIDYNSAAERAVLDSWDEGEEVTEETFGVVYDRITIDGTVEYCQFSGGPGGCMSISLIEDDGSEDFVSNDFVKGSGKVKEVKDQAYQYTLTFIVERWYDVSHWKDADQYREDNLSYDYSLTNSNPIKEFILYGTTY